MKTCRTDVRRYEARTFIMADFTVLTLSHMWSSREENRTLKSNAGFCFVFEASVGTPRGKNKGVVWHAQRTL